METTQYPPTNEQINRMRSIHTMEHHSFIKKEKILIQAIIQMHHESTTQSKRCQTQKAPYYRIPFICNVQNRPTTETERRSVLVRAWGSWGVQKIFWD